MSKEGLSGILNELILQKGGLNVRFGVAFWQIMEIFNRCVPQKKECVDSRGTSHLSGMNM
jgi:hypothetical protein